MASSRNQMSNDTNDRERPLSSMATPDTPILDDGNRPLSVVSTSSYTPQITLAARDRQRSLATEILGSNHRLVFGDPSSEVSSPDGQDVSRLSGVSGLTEHSGAKPVPSPPAGQIARSPSLSTTFEKGIEKSISSPVAISNSLGFAAEKPETSTPKNVKSHRQSQFIENFGTEDVGAEPVASIEASKSDVVDWPFPTPTASPAPGKQSHELSAVQSGMSSSTDPNIVATKSPKTAATPHVTVISPQARKGTRTNFLPKFLRSKSPQAELDYEQRKAIEEKVQPEESQGKKVEAEAVSPKAFFDDGSSDEGEDSQIESAQEAKFASPVMVKHGSVTKVGLKEMLRSTPPAVDDDRVPSRDKKLSILGEDLEWKKDMPISRRESLYEHQDAEISRDGSLGMGLWKEINPFSPSAVKSQKPSQRPTPVPNSSQMPKAARRVSFPSPPPLDIRPEHRFLRQSIVSTPYPSENDEEQTRQMSVPSTMPQSEPQVDSGSEPELTLVVYGNGNLSPRVKKIVMPDSQEVFLVDDRDERKPPISATMKKDFDDEKLFKLIRKEYASMRGCWKQIASARTVRRISLLSYQSTSQLISRHAKTMHFHFKAQDGDFAEARILSLFKKPKFGKKHHEWTQWIRSQPENIEEGAIDTDKLALELVEGWSPGKLYIAIAAVLICSLAAALLWIFVGVGGGNLALNDAFGAFAQLRENDVGYRNAGQRVGTGAVLGLLVLFIGWTTVGAWVLLSWLVM